MVCNGFKAFAEATFDYLEVEWYDGIPSVSTEKQQQLIVYCYTSNLEELVQHINSSPTTDEIRKIVLIVSGSMNGLSELVSLGVTGFFSLDCSLKEFQSAFQKILHNQNYYCDVLWQKILSGTEEPTDSVEMNHNLTKREFEVVEKLVHGFSTEEIGKQLGLSPHTVQTHRKNSFKKLKISSLSDLLLLEMKHRLFRK